MHVLHKCDWCECFCVRYLIMIVSHIITEQSLLFLAILEWNFFFNSIKTTGKFSPSWRVGGKGPGSNIIMNQSLESLSPSYSTEWHDFRQHTLKPTTPPHLRGFCTTGLEFLSLWASGRSSTQQSQTPQQRRVPETHAFPLCLWRESGEELCLKRYQPHIWSRELRDRVGILPIPL